VAGESPGRVEQQESSGEATGRRGDDREASEALAAAEEVAADREQPSEKPLKEASKSSSESSSESSESAESFSGSAAQESGTTSDLGPNMESRVECDSESESDSKSGAEASSEEEDAPVRAVEEEARSRRPVASNGVASAAAQSASAVVADASSAAQDDVDGDTGLSSDEHDEHDEHGEENAAKSASADREEPVEPEEPEEPAAAQADGVSEQADESKDRRDRKASGESAGPKSSGESADRKASESSNGREDSKASGGSMGTKPLESGEASESTGGSQEQESPDASEQPPQQPSRACDGPEGPEGGPGESEAGKARPAAHTASRSAPEAPSREPSREPGTEPGKEPEKEKDSGKESGKDLEPRWASGAPVASAQGDSVASVTKSATAGTKAVEAPRKTAAGTVAGRQSTFVPLVPQDPDQARERARPAPDDDALAPKRERTKQLPVPPVPGEPLKLLAELTNTPPPPETLLRVVWRRVKIWTPLVVLLVLVVGTVQALRPLPDPELTATGDTSYTFGGGKLAMPWPGQGQSVVEVEGLGSLGHEGAQKPVPIASVTKVMTAYVILKDHPLSGKANGPTITIDSKAASESSSEDESTAKVREGQRFTERQMLELLLIPSGNNIARMLARWDAGSDSAFVKKMTKAAAELGMKNTTYTGSSGFESTTRSTAVDQLKLARQVMKNDVFQSVVATPNVNIPGVGMIYNNNNLLVNMGVLGIKTGSSTPAGGALMWAAKRTVEGKRQMILGVVLHQRGGSTVYDSLQLALNNSMNLIKAVQEGLTSATVVKKGEVVGYVDDGLGGKTPVVATESLTAIGWAGLTRELKLTASASGIPHQAKAGTKVGTVSFGSGSALTKVPVALKTEQTEPSFSSKLTRLG
jgi:serine-type D-Ala-D-Ala carboxypeptidase (penicillin-binding protein 5/6)